MSQEAEELRRQCLLGARFIWRELRELYGHVSGRLPNGEGFVLMMVRVPTAGFDPDEVLTYDYEGNKVQGAQPGANEIYLHSEIYRARPDVQSIVHTHPHVATALSTTGQTIYALTHQGRQFGKGIPVFKGDFITTPQLGRELAECLGGASAALMKGHGAVMVGNSVPDSVALAIYIEQAAKQLLWASLLGTPEPLPQHLLDWRWPHEGRAPNNLWRQLVWDLETQQSYPNPDTVI